MHTEETRHQFIELRARGWSLGHIATELDVSKRTLVDWNKEYSGDVESFRGLELPEWS
jgi:orotate phosphoribosyltransferase-like protein